ncbi:hypothetical protein V8C42DRAFT_325742 [Trichoderma barbatum]
MLAPWKEDDRKQDFIINAINNIDAKATLLKYCYDNKLPVINSMGGGCKGDLTKIVIGDIGRVKNGGLSRATRRRLKLL